MIKKPDFSYEELFWQKGMNVVGVDEVGRGSLAGPVVAGAAMIRIMNYELGIMNQNKNFHNSKFKILNSILKLGIDDSKRLRASAREKLLPEIEKYFQTAIGEASVSEINKLGIVKATRLAMRRAVIRIMIYDLSPASAGFRKRREIMNDVFLLVDGYRVKYLPGGYRRQLAIIKGDQKSISIAAASVVAKVYRDKLMQNLNYDYPKYNWDQNKGYGTFNHREALKNYGLCVQHRLLFVDSLVDVKAAT